MNMLVKGMTVALVVALASGFASAQEEKEKKDKGRRPHKGFPIEMLKEKLSLTEEQVKQVEEIVASYEEKMKAAREKIRGAEGDAKDEAIAAIKELRKELIGKIREILTDEQKEKLDALEAQREKGRKKEE